MGNGQSEEINCEDEELVNEYIELKGGRKRLSVQEFSKRVSLKMERENRPISASHEDTLQELFHDKTHIGFEEYLTWKVKTVSLTRQKYFSYFYMTITRVRGRSCRGC